MSNPDRTVIVAALAPDRATVRPGMARLAGVAAMVSFVALLGLIATHLTVYPAPAPSRHAGIPAAWHSAPADPFTAFQHGRFGKAYRGFNKLIEAGKDSYRTRYFRGLTQEIFHRYGPALGDMLAAIKLNPDSLQAYKHANWLYARQSRWSKIITLWDGYLARHPHDSDAYLAQAGAFRRAGRMAASREALDKACEYGADLACAILYPLT